MLTVTHLSAWRVQRREAEVRLVGHEVGSLHLQDGFVSGQGGQVSVTHHLVVHSGLKADAGQWLRGRTLTTQESVSGSVSYCDGRGRRPRGAQAFGRWQVDQGYLSLHL